MKQQGKPGSHQQRLRVGQGRTKPKMTSVCRQILAIEVASVADALPSRPQRTLAVVDVYGQILSQF